MRGGPRRLGGAASPAPPGAASPGAARRAPCQAWQLAQPAPDVYKDLGGTYGLVVVDPAWGMLDTSEPPAIGTSFVTTAMLEASASPLCVSAEGFCTPVNNQGRIEYHPQETAVVRFCSAAADRAGAHSLVPTALTEEEMEYDLPPLSRITLQRVDEAGSWQAYGVTVNQRLLTVSVAFAFPWARG